MAPDPRPAPAGAPLVPADLADRLDPIDAAVPSAPGLRPAAVVLLLMRREPGDPEPRLCLIERSSELRAHAGQIAFPGGKPEADDRSLAHTALREASEEVGLPPQGTEVLGRVRPIPTPTNFMVVPFLGWAPVGWQPRITSPEVHRLLTPSLRTLADPDHHRIAGYRSWRGFEYPLHEFTIDTPSVWGATAHILWDLLQRLGLTSRHQQPKP